MKQKAVPGQKIICLNRKASFNYFFIEIIEAGISLKGSEVKSLRDGKGNIADSYAVDNNGELFLIEYRAEDPLVPIKTIHKMSEKQAIKEMEAAGFKLRKNIDNLPWQHCMIFVKNN